MSKESIRKFRKIYGICMAAYSGVVGLLFIIQVWSIFLASPNGDPYTRASIAAAFSQIAVFVWLWVAAAIFGAFIPKAEPIKPKAYLSSQLQIERLRKRVVLSEEDEKGLKGLIHFRIGAYCALAIVWIVVAIVGVCILADTSYQPKFAIEFFQEHNSLVDRIVCILPWLLGGLVISIAATIAAEKSRILEMILLKEIFKKQVSRENAQPLEIKEEKVCFLKRAYNAVSAFLQKPTVVLITRITLGVIGVVFVVFGIFNGGMADVLEKAVKICTQCIGLG